MSTPEASTDTTAANQASTAAPASAPPEEVENQEEESLVGAYVQILEIIERMISRAGSDAFVKAMQKSFATQTAKELKSNVYELMKGLGVRGGMVAKAVEELEEDYEDLRDELASQGRVLRDLLSTSIVQIAWNLSRLCLERSQDPDIRALAQNIVNALTPQTTEAVSAPAPAPAPQPENGVAAPAPAAPAVQP